MADAVATAVDDETERLLAAMEPHLARYRDSKQRRESLALIMALRLAGHDLEVMEALCRRERVPRSRLDQRWCKAYGL